MIRETNPKGSHPSVGECELEERDTCSSILAKAMAHDLEMETDEARQQAVLRLRQDAHQLTSVYEFRPDSFAFRTIRRIVQSVRRHSATRRIMPVTKPASATA
jgi:hypothetical protein